MAESLPRSIYRKAAHAWERQRRGSLSIPVSSELAVKPTVYFLTPDVNIPAGGSRVIYRHVDILNSAGTDAFVLHRRSGFRLSWFDNDTQVTDLGKTVIKQGDLLVVPEPDIDYLPRLKAGTRHVIFNQNSHLTWKRAGAEAKDVYVGSPDLAAVITVSAHNKEMLECAFPNTAIRRVRLGLNPGLFSPLEGMPGRRIGYMPRRGSSDAKQVIEIMRARGTLEGWELVPIEGLTHSEVARHLKSTMIFLAFTHQEGFGLPAAEAMSCGNYVIGNHGFGGKEFFRPEFSMAIQNGDILGFVNAIEAALSGERSEPGWCRARGLAASRFIRSEYAPEREHADVVETYDEILGSTRFGRDQPVKRTKLPENGSSLRW